MVDLLTKCEIAAQITLLYYYLKNGARILGEIFQIPRMRGVHRVAYWKSIPIYAASIDTSLAYLKLFFSQRNFSRIGVFFSHLVYTCFSRFGLPGMKYAAFNILVEMLFFRSLLRRLIFLAIFPISRLFFGPLADYKIHINMYIY